eukprot:scaffold38643_cov20-Tisochrysis_lutea.AAC.1
MSVKRVYWAIVASDSLPRGREGRMRSPVLAEGRQLAALTYYRAEMPLGRGRQAACSSDLLLVQPTFVGKDPEQECPLARGTQAASTSDLLQ